MNWKIEDSDRARRYRLRAEEVFAIAEQCVDKAIKKQMMEMSKGWEDMAESAARIDATNARLRKAATRVL